MYEVKEQKLFGHSYFGCVNHDNTVHQEENGQPYFTPSRIEAEEECIRINGGPYKFCELEWGMQFTLGFGQYKYMKVNGKGAKFPQGDEVKCICMNDGQGMLCTIDDNQIVYKVQDGK